jgi:hypothetical protein
MLLGALRVEQGSVLSNHGVISKAFLSERSSESSVLSNLQSY